MASSGCGSCSGASILTIVPQLARGPVRLGRSMQRTVPILIAALAFALVPALAPAAARASAAQESLFQEDDLLPRTAASGREATLDQLQALGVDTIHTLVGWSALAPAPTSKTRPQFDAFDPDDYPADGFGAYDGLLRSAQRRGMQVIFTVSGFAPAWASNCGGPVSVRRTCKPDAGAFRSFVAMLGRRYWGSYDPGDGQGPLPRVDRWSIWNEPNQSVWLYPQRVRHGSSVIPFAPILYRKMVQGATSGLDATGHGSDQILLGGTAPLGPTTGRRGRGSLAPMDFLRETFCLDRHWRPYRGRDARLRHCSSREHLDVNGLAHHPYTRAASRDPRAAIGRGDLTVSTLARLRVAADRAALQRVIPRGVPLSLTELGFQTGPPDRLAGTSLSRQAKWLNYSEFQAYRQPRVAGIAQYQLREEPKLAGFQTGLQYKDGSAKPALDAYRLPIWVTRSGSRVRVWGRVRGAAAGEPADVQYHAGSDWVTAATLQTNDRGFVDTLLAKHSVWRLVHGEEVSRTARLP